ncbi:hypothetical protein EIP86_001678 [Pleurotus ostreatoroseus]|nr:hypothetical protein EIP86_001678 [Pleurotus ostreatoroseus]
MIPMGSGFAYGSMPHEGDYLFPTISSFHANTNSLPALPVCIPSQPREQTQTSNLVHVELDTIAPVSHEPRTIVLTEAPDPLTLLLEQFKEVQRFGKHNVVSTRDEPVVSSSIAIERKHEKVKPRRPTKRLSGNSTSLACYYCRQRKIRCGGPSGVDSTSCRYALVGLIGRASSPTDYVVANARNDTCRAHFPPSLVVDNATKKRHSRPILQQITAHTTNNILVFKFQRLPQHTKTAYRKQSQARNMRHGT